MALAVRAAGANGGTPRLAREPVGPFLVSAWTRPDPPRPGVLDLSVAVMTSPGGDPELSADVAVRAEPSPPGGGGPISLALQRGAGGNLLIHHGEVELSAPGTWTITVSVAGPAGGGSAAFDVRVESAPARAWIAIGAVVGALGAAVAWRRLATRRGGPAGRHEHPR